MKLSLGDAKTKALAAITDVLAKNNLVHPMGQRVDVPRLAEFIFNGMQRAGLTPIDSDDALALQDAKKHGR